MTLLFVLGLYLSACQPEPASLTLPNPSGGALVDAPFTLTRSEVEAKLGPLPGDQSLHITQEKQPVPFQLDDLDGDGAWDEAFGLAEYPREGLDLQLSLSPQAPEPPEPKTQVYLARIGEPGGKLATASRVPGADTKVTQQVYQFEGPGWENELIAFRNYFDGRNGMDIFGKQVSELILPQVGIDSSYHELQPWGMDVLKVGNSLGAGALALQYQDGLYRVIGDSTGTFTLLKEGPLRSVFRFDLPNVPVGDTTVKVSHQVSIIAGMPGYLSSVEVSPQLDSLRLVSGIVNLESDTFYLNQTPTTRILYTHAEQGYEGEYLGMALLAHAADQPEVLVAPEEGEGVVQTYGWSMNLYPDRPTRLAFLAGWEVRDSTYQDRAVFSEMVQQEAKKWAVLP